MGVFINADCMDYLNDFADNEFDLAIVDPPYGGGALSADTSSATFNVSRTGGKWATKYQTNGGFFDEDIRHWDIAPEPVYFKQLARVSRNQIIWGGNYFDLPPTRCFLVWRKTNIPAEGFTMSAVEYAWTSFDRNAQCYEKGSAGTPANPRIHPTQKPITLYTWILDKFAQPGQKILDTHVGSGSSLIACERMGFDYVGFEINKVYYRLAQARIEQETRQLTLF